MTSFVVDLEERTPEEMYILVAHIVSGLKFSPFMVLE